MNLYFLFEGDQTEPFLYPIWISKELPHLSRIDFISEAQINNYYVFSGGGIPSIYKHAVNAIKDINDNGKFDFLVICVDAENIGIEQRISKFSQYFENARVELTGKCKIIYIVQKACIETWFLGNRKIVRRNPTGERLQRYLEHYNVINKDPEQMDRHADFVTDAQFHYSYFREVLKEHNLVYKKSKLDIVSEQYFFDEIVKRVEETQHINSFKTLLDFFAFIKTQRNS